MKKALTIAGSDSSGGAGIQADIKTFSAHGVFGMSVITAVTAQNTLGVFGIQDISEEMIHKQIQAIFDDIQVDATKIGMVSNSNTILTIAQALKAYPLKNLVLDPVMISKSGFPLLQPHAREALIKWLLPMATVITPNLMEAEVITGMSISNVADMEEAAKKIHAHGPDNVLVKGGHLVGEAIDVLFDGTDFQYFKTARIHTENTHGTGCTLSSAIAANLALGMGIEESVEKAKAYITTAIQHSFSIGKGVGPTHHFYDLYEKSGIH